MTRLMTQAAAQRASRGRRAYVPLSIDAIDDPDFLAHVIATVRRHQAEPRLITFAIPLDLMPRAGRLAERLGACGFELRLVEN